MIVLAWLWFFVVQLLMLLATVVGWVLLIPFCLLQAWTPPNPPLRYVDRWRWKWLNYIYGNPEDGVSGQQALIWQANMKLGTATQVSYMPNAWAPWRAYLWSGWRNSADNLKYVFAWENGPFVQWGGFKMGWQNGLPVLS